MYKILIIEDDLSIASLQKDYLEINNMMVDLAIDGKIGLDLALKQDYDCIITDIMLPKLDGFEICKALRKEKQTPIIIISAKTDDIDKIRGLGLGADDYMEKPFSPNELVARVKAHISRYQTLKDHNASHQFVESNKIKIDKHAHKVFLDNQEVNFTHMEYNLLLFFIENSNRVFSKEDLFEKIWGWESYDTDVSTVVVHIKKIRSKISKHIPNHQPIETIWGSGYRFNL